MKLRYLFQDNGELEKNCVLFRDFTAYKVFIINKTMKSNAPFLTKVYLQKKNALKYVRGWHGKKHWKVKLIKEKWQAFNSKPIKSKELELK